MKPISRPFLADLPADPDVIIVGAGAAGIGAARFLREAGLSIAILEARDRIGGRAVTASLKGHPIDLGAHWLHAGPINPLVRLGQQRGERLRHAPVQSHLFVHGRPGRQDEQAALGRAFGIADRAMTVAARRPADQAAASVLTPMGPFGQRVIAIHGLVSGRPLTEVSLHDFPSMEYSDNWFIAGGLGAYVARLAQGLPIRLNTRVSGIDWSGSGVAVATSAGTLKAKAVLMSVPMAVLQQEAIRFTPDLPAATSEAIHAFTQGVYEHVVLHWPHSPFHGPDRLANLLGRRGEPPGLLTRIDGTPFCFLELDQPTATGLDGRDPYAPARLARMILSQHFGHRGIAGIGVCTVTGWHRDPFSGASWAVLPPGQARARAALKAPVGDRLWLAGEALSQAQWGTAGGAWEEGERAAEEIVRQLKA